MLQLLLLAAFQAEMSPFYVFFSQCAGTMILCFSKTGCVLQSSVILEILYTLGFSATLNAGFFSKVSAFLSLAYTSVFLQLSILLKNYQ